MMARCYPCEVRIVHPFHDNGQVADPIMCEDIGGSTPMSNGQHKYSAQWWRERFNPVPPIVIFDRSKGRMEGEDFIEVQRLILAHTEFNPGDVKSARVTTESGYIVITMRVYVIDHGGKRFIDATTDEAATTLEIVTIPVPAFYEAFNG
jgi:hypothetical protein